MKRCHSFRSHSLTTVRANVHACAAAVHAINKRAFPCILHVKIAHTCVRGTFQPFVWPLHKRLESPILQTAHFHLGFLDKTIDSEKWQNVLAFVHFLQI